MTSLVCKYVLFCARYYRRKCRKCPRIVKYSFAQRGCQKGNFWAIVNRTITHFTPQRIPLQGLFPASSAHSSMFACNSAGVATWSHASREIMWQSSTHTALFNRSYIMVQKIHFCFAPSLTSPCTVPGVQVQWNKNDKWKELGTLLVWEIHCVWVTCSMGPARNFSISSLVP